jgi:hypothetical protein
MLDFLKKHWASWVIISLGIIVFCLIAVESEAFKECLNHSYYESSDHEPEKGAPLIFSTLGWTKACAGEFLRQDGEAITAFFTLVLSISTIALWQSTHKLWIAGEQQIEIAGRALMATHRPKIGIRRLTLNLASLQDKQGAEATFVLLNKGASTARIKEQNGIIYFRNPSGAWPYDFDTYEGKIEVCPDNLPEGAAVDVKIRSAGSYKEANLRINGIVAIYAAGRILYEDETGTTRTTAFCRIYDTKDFRFRPVGDPEYEYED